MRIKWDPTTFNSGSTAAGGTDVITGIWTVDKPEAPIIADEIVLEALL